ncbi:hypothetical protein [Adhaeribacter aquaticus]|uniref:hypothetical protein n=1 Tax=Adhaeribacter aquaticus TaxID=299567 RepID=UPI0004793D46|nr:hypothetical protein [Adhaeribacter aquaticus]
MHILLLSISLLITGFLFEERNETYKVHDLRTMLEIAAKNKEACEKLIKHLDGYNGKDPVVLGFEAAAHGIMAKHAWSPYYKMRYLRTSAKMFEEVIKEHPQVAEIRFLRYTLEYFIPRYLNMSEHMDEDKKVFLMSLLRYPNSDLDGEIIQNMRRFLLKHPDNLTEQEKKQLNNIKA